MNSYMESEKPTKDLIVDVSSSEVKIALMEDHRLIEFNTESVQGTHFSVGDVYLGKVKKILPSLNAAFVDIGDKKEAFVHYLDLGLYFNAFDRFVKESNQNTNLHQQEGIPLCASDYSPLFRNCEALWLVRKRCCSLCLSLRVGNWV